MAPVACEVQPQRALRAIQAALLCACLGLLLSGCYITGDHWTPPTYPDDGKRDSPPRYIQVLHWEKHNYAYARNWQDRRWYTEHYVLMDRGPQGIHVGKGWYVPSWTRIASVNHPKPTWADNCRTEMMARRYPPGTVLRIDYPLLEDKSLIGRRGSVRASSADTWAPGAYGDMIIIEGIGGPRDEVPEVFWRPDPKRK